MTGFGLDVGATKTLGVVVDADGTVLAETREPTRLGADGVVHTVGSVVGQLRAATGLAPTYPVGVGIPGLVDIRDGTVSHAVNLGLNGDLLPLRTLLADELQFEVALDNDVNAATYGAAHLTGAADLAYLSIGTGLAAGLMLDGRLRRGHLAAAGEIGHIPIDPHGDLCPCGQRGCLETVASGSALAAAWPTSGAPAAQVLFAAAEAGDAEAVALRRRFAAAVAAAVRLLALTVDVRCLVLGGGVSQLGEPLRAAVADALAEQAGQSPFLASLALAERVVVLPPGRPVAAIGAALLGTFGGTEAGWR